MASPERSCRRAALALESATAPFDEPTLERLADTLRTLGLDFDIAFYEVARRRDPDHPSALEALGHAYTQRGLLARGLEVDRRLAELRPEDPIARYNLACSYALVGELELGIATLERAIELGYTDLEHLERDSDFDSLRGDSRFQELTKRLAPRRA